MNPVNPVKINKQLASTAIPNEIVQSSEHISTIFGNDSVLDPKSQITRSVSDLLSDTIAWELLDLIRGGSKKEQKVSSLWEKYLPTPLNKAERMAARAVRENDDYAWDRFLALPEIRQALMDDVLLNWIADLTSIQSFLKHEKFLIYGIVPQGLTEEESQKYAQYKGQFFKDVNPFFNMAKDETDKTVRYVFPPGSVDMQNPDCVAGIEAYKLTRMAAYRKLTAHFLGTEEFELSNDLGGTGFVHKKITSSAIDADKSDMRIKRALSFVRLGQAKSAIYNVPDKANLRTLLAEIYKECSHSSSVKGTKHNWDHPISQLSSAICPLMAMTPEKLRQKNLPIEVAYSLLRAADTLKALEATSLFPLLGTGMNPKGQLPPDFVERFDPEWRKSQRLSLSTLQYLGFPVIIHKGVKPMMATIHKLVPELDTHLEQTTVFEDLKDARTYQIFVSPIKKLATQRMLWSAYESKYPEAKKIATSICNSDTATRLQPAQRTVYVANELTIAALNEFNKDPEGSLHYLEEKLLGNKTQAVYKMSIPSDLVWAPGLREIYQKHSPPLSV